ncbi:hypothetical protein CDD81_5873 [Ophiocordyceps australis]|uniref:Peptidase M20 dimerisation domain-containing protein n=1 Tax=Ophiocordyceps australis TaxID=1399860 RepID=A0A2C5YIL0_9HYPO|nr:hypothetical protein CDD81_5873 [Ophiocordyceps australis]
MRPRLLALVSLLPPWASCLEQKPLAHVDNAASAYANELLSLHESLVSIESVSGNEGPVANFLDDYLSKRGYTVFRQHVQPLPDVPDNENHTNIIAWHGRGLRPRARVVLTSHIDTVPPPIPYSIGQGPGGETIIKGRGSVDAKGSVAAMVVALGRLLAEKRVADDDVLLLFVVGEEAGGGGMLTFSDSLGPDPNQFEAVIFGEPTQNKLACGHKGALDCRLEALGVPGHSGYPALGKSANERMIHAMARLLDEDLGSSENFGNTTVNVGYFNGGVAGNVIAEHALVKMVTRVAVEPEESGAEVVRQRILDILHQVDDEAFTLDCAHGYGPVKTNCDVPGFETDVMAYGTDIGNLRGNHTRYLYGPGSILVAHGANESLTVEALTTSVDDFQRLILHALNK